ncbi:MAG: hypothetical protein AAF290_12690 [Pseudomonadota bacterium]
MRRWFALFLLMSSLTAHAGSQVDEATGLIIDEHWELVMGMCGSCHSYKLVTSQRGDRKYWLKTIRWMQASQNLWPIPPAIESQILDYLAKNYSEAPSGRRPALSPELMPD